MQQSSSSPSLSSTLALAPADAVPDAPAAPPTYRRAAASTPAASWAPSPRPPPASKSPAHTMNWFMIGGSGGCALAAVGDALAGLQARCEEIIARGDELADGCTDLLSLVGSVRAQIADS